MHQDFCKISICYFCRLFSYVVSAMHHTENTSFNFCFCGPLRLLFDVFPLLYALFFCRALLSRENFYRTLGCTGLVTFYFLVFAP